MDAAEEVDAVSPDEGAVDAPPPVETNIDTAGGTVVSDDGKLVLEVPAGAVAQTTKITVVVVRDAPRGSVSVGYDIGPTGMPFTVPATLRIAFGGVDLQGIDASRLRLGTLVGGAWQEVRGSTVDLPTQEVRGALEHLSVYGVIAGQGPRCGDVRIDSGEQCDGTELGGADCVAQGFDDGTLACRADCTFDTSACTRCGDGKLNGTEQCDGADLGGKWCGSLGFANGALGCNADCTFDTSACNKCGDGKISGGEQCEGTNLSGASCADLGFDGGILACKPYCAFDTSGCFKCHDGVINGTEQCEGLDLGGASCQLLGFDAGTLACSIDCAFDTSKCSTCGDGVATGAESCDGSALGGATCSMLGYVGGSLGCTASCTFDTSSCIPPPWCGDGLRNGTEPCEGEDVGGATCVTQGFDGGTLACAADCTFVTSACFKCGDDELNGLEQCDGADLGGATCTSLGTGFYAGTLGCAPNCTFDTSSCKTIADIVADVLADEAISNISTAFPETEVEAQMALPGDVSFEQALRAAITSFLEDGTDIESPQELIRWDTSDPLCPVPLGLTERVRCYMNRSTSLLAISYLDGQVHGSVYPPAEGESVADNWVFYLYLSDLSDHLHWAVVKRFLVGGVISVYNYGFN